jgi:hypothetical protein
MASQKTSFADDVSHWLLAPAPSGAEVRPPVARGVHICLSTWPNLFARGTSSHAPLPAEPGLARVAG